MANETNIFVPGRLCLAGEHSDWAASYSVQDSAITMGAALVVTLQQGLHATARRSNSSVILSSALAGHAVFPADASLEKIARSASPTSLWRYAAGVAHIINTRFEINGGIEVRITDATLPPAKGLSSSASLCVLIARAYNLVYGLKLSPAGEMELAYAGERLTGSMCGKMDQIVAIGPGQAARMQFKADDFTYKVVAKPKKPLFFVVADLGASKNTTRILSGLQTAYSGNSGSSGDDLKSALGSGNLNILNKMQSALEGGNAEMVGACMVTWQEEFDSAAIPFCPDELASPILHRTLVDGDVTPLVYGGKGVGSQGDGSVQFIAKDRNCALTLIKVLRNKLGTEPLLVPLGEDEDPVAAPSRLPKPMMKLQGTNKIHTAVIPAAGFGTRLFPASRSIRPKALFPVVDKDGFAKPLLLCLVEECVRAGIERVIVVVGPGEQEERVKEVFAPVPKDLYAALNPHMREYAGQITRLERLVEVAIQPEPKGFGHAVACADVGEDSPFALLLGDVLFRSHDTNKSCLRQTINAFLRSPSRSVIGVTQVPLAESQQYGVVKVATELKADGTGAAIEKIVEKPDLHEAEECSRNGMCNVVLGPYIFTPSLMTQLRKDVEENRMERGEIQLTSAMATVLGAEGMQAVLINGDTLDTGNAVEYIRTISKLGS